MQRYFNFRAPGRIKDARKSDAELPAKRRGREDQDGNILEHPRCDKERRETLSTGTRLTKGFKKPNVCIQAEWHSVSNGGGKRLVSSEVGR